MAQIFSSSKELKKSVHPYGRTYFFDSLEGNPPAPLVRAGRATCPYGSQSG